MEGRPLPAPTAAGTGRTGARGAGRARARGSLGAEPRRPALPDTRPPAARLSRARASGTPGSSSRVSWTIASSPWGSTRKASWTRVSAVSTATRNTRRSSSSGGAAEVAGEQVDEPVGDPGVGPGLPGTHRPIWLPKSTREKPGAVRFMPRYSVQDGVHGGPPVPLAGLFHALGDPLDVPLQVALGEGVGHLPFVAEEAVDRADGDSGAFGDRARAQGVVADLVEEFGAGVQNPGQPFGTAPLDGRTAKRCRMGHGLHDAFPPGSGEPHPTVRRQVTGALMRRRRRRRSSPRRRGRGRDRRLPAPVSAPDTVMSAVLSTGLPWTAHTVPSSAYRRAVIWWVPCGDAVGGQVVGGGAQPGDPAAVHEQVGEPPAGDRHRPRVRRGAAKCRKASRTSQPPAGSGVTSTRTSGAFSPGTSRRLRPVSSVSSSTLPHGRGRDGPPRASPVVQAAAPSGSRAHTASAASGPRVHFVHDMTGSVEQRPRPPDPPQVWFRPYLCGRTRRPLARTPHSFLRCCIESGAQGAIMSDGGTSRASVFERGGARKTAEGLSYLTGFGNEHALGGGAGCPARGPQLAAARTARPVRRAAERVRRSPSPGRTTGAPGCTASALGLRTRRSPAPTTARSVRPRSPRPCPTPTGCAGTRCRSRRPVPTSSAACGPWAATAT